MTIIQSAICRSSLFKNEHFATDWKAKKDEAFDLADRIAILDQGVIEQVGTPGEIIQVPASSFVRTFVEDIATHRISATNIAPLKPRKII